MRLRLLDLDGSLMAQPLFQEAVAAGRAQRVDLRDEGVDLRLWASRRAMRRLEKTLAKLPPPPGAGLPVTFLGSGDYHHLTAALLAVTLREEPAGSVTLLHFDNHPDWVRWPPAYHCGSWVNRALELRQIHRVVTIGPTASDLERPQVRGGNIPALSCGRIELYPWRHAPSRVFGRVSAGAGHRHEAGHLLWRNVGGADWPAFLDDMSARLSTASLWITVDKDVLRPEDAATNWDQGEMPLVALLEAVLRLTAGRRLLGVDVCGDYAPPRFDSRLKRIAARFDQPPPASVPPDLSRNERTNRLLLEHLREIAA